VRPVISVPFDLGELDYDLPKDRIAQEPAARRDDARLLVMDRKAGALLDQRVADLPAFLRRGDLLVLNDTKVVPARFTLERGTGGLIEGLFLDEIRVGLWRVFLRGGGRLKAKEPVVLGEHVPGLNATVVERRADGEFVLRVECSESAFAVLERVGRTPLPPYINRKSEDERREVADRQRYQTVYAREPGAVAAPTAGLHLTAELLQALEVQGIALAYLTLHVGPGTFKPIEVADLAQHRMHEERFDLPPETTKRIGECRVAGGRVVAVGTTSVRALESAWEPGHGGLRAGAGATSLFIHPPYRFRAVDSLMTNFHLPQSTLLALVMAFAGVGTIRRAYAHAIAEKYRFYSYGDAMLIL